MKTIQERNFKIDVLRGVSILFVLLLHINIRVPFNTTALGESLPPFIYKLLFWSGYYGVEIFFVVSGFLITNSVLQKYGSVENVNITQFYKMRFARIAPLLLLLLAVLSVLSLCKVEGYTLGDGANATLGEALLAALTFSINWLEIKVGYLPGSWDILWSLSIEEVFYIVFPLICVLCKKTKYFIMLMVLLTFISPIFRNFWFTDSDLAERNNFACMGGMALGCIGAIIANKNWVTTRYLPLLKITGWILFGVVMLLRSPLYKLGISKIGLNVSILSIGITMLLIYWQIEAVNGQNKKYRALAFLSGLGRHSYEIYLTHMFVVMSAVSLYNLIESPSNCTTYLLYFTVLLFSYLLGAVIAKFYSNPLNGYLRGKRK